MSKAIKISDENYRVIEDMAFRNGVPINTILNKVLDERRKTDSIRGIIVEYRGRKVKIR